jgi:hypothetical protein
LSFNNFLNLKTSTTQVKLIQKCSNSGICETYYERSSWECNGNCINISTPCNGKCNSGQLNCQGFCEEDLSYIWCNGACQSNEFSCNETCLSSTRPAKCPKANRCVSSWDLCYDSIPNHARDVCPGLREFCEKTEIFHIEKTCDEG